MAVAVAAVVAVVEVVVAVAAAAVAMAAVEAAAAIAVIQTDLIRFRLRYLDFFRLYFSLLYYIQKFEQFVSYSDISLQATVLI